MVITFTSQLEGIDWIANKVQNEDQFEILREELLWNFIYFGSYFLDVEKTKSEAFERVELWRLGDQRN